MGGRCSGKEFGLYTASAESSFTSICEDQCIGFGYGMNQGGSSVRDLSAGAKISNFGFPFHVKYHGTSSNLIKMSEYISAPFLLEKIVLEWSGALAYNNTYDKTVTTFAASTFFILNQRKPYGFNNSSVQRFVYKLSDQHTGYVTSGAFIPGAYNGGDEVNTVRELVTFSQVMGFSNAAGTTTKQRAARELNLTSTDGSWSGRFIMSGTVKTAFPTEGLSEFKIGHNDLGFLSMMLINQNSTRTGLFTPGGRDFVGALENGNRVASSIALLSNYPLTTEPTGVIVTIDRYSKPNPYLLQPSDELIFGWQLPVSNMVNSSNNTGQYAGKGPELFFDNVPSKITFYGSMISENKEVHDTLNQLLSSVTIHEEIG